MKKHLILLLFISAHFCFGQSDYAFTKSDGVHNRFHKKMYNVIKYDSLKNITTVELYKKPETNLIGKWFDFNHIVFMDEHLITHCPVFVDENDVILEFGIFDLRSHEGIFGYDFRELRTNYLEHTRPKSVLISEKAVETNKIYLYKIKMPYRDNDKQFFTSYHLIAKKGNFIYKMVIYNIDETNFDNFDTFLINTFNTNSKN